MWFDDDEAAISRVCGAVLGESRPWIAVRDEGSPHTGLRALEDGVHDGQRRLGIVSPRVKGGKEEPLLSTLDIPACLVSYILASTPHQTEFQQCVISLPVFVS